MARTFSRKVTIRLTEAQHVKYQTLFRRKQRYEWGELLRLLLEEAYDGFEQRDLAEAEAKRRIAEAAALPPPKAKGRTAKAPAKQARHKARALRQRNKRKGTPATAAGELVELLPDQVVKNLVQDNTWEDRQLGEGWMQDCIVVIEEGWAAPSCPRCAVIPRVFDYHEPTERAYYQCLACGTNWQSSMNA